ncbi:MAG: adenylate/guanylate cyclase domain-containing protein [Dehalococcoidia bacterium]
METPRVRYSTTTDGVAIAYTVTGHGPPLVYLQPYSHQQLDRQFPAMASWYEGLAQTHTLIRLDARESGLSQRGTAGPDPGAVVLDLEAVIKANQLEHTDLFGASSLGFAPLAYAHQNPDRVDHLVLWGTPAHGADVLTASRMQSLRAAQGIDADVAAEMTAMVIFGEGVPLDEQRSHYITETLSHDIQTRYLDSLENFDGTVLGAELRCPVLVLHPSRRAYVSRDSSQRLAASIPNAEFVVVDSGYFPYQAASQEQLANTIDEFLGVRRVVTVPAPSPFRTILFTDVVASTPLLTQLRDAKMREVMRDHDAVMEAAVTGHGGRVVKTIGDAFMAEFAVPSAAVEAAIEVQRAIREKFADSGVPVRIRIGINAGEPIEEDGDLHGASVVIAKRLESAADSNGILVSDVVKQMVTGKEFDFEDRGPVELKGFDEPVRAWAVRWE